MNALFSNLIGGPLAQLRMQLMLAFAYVAHINYVPGTPSTLSGMSATSIRRITWEKKLRRDSIRPSCFEQLKTALKVVDGVVNIVKAGIFMEIDVDPTSGQSCRVAFRKPLTKAPRYGTDQDVLGNEDEQDLLYTELYYNEIKKGVKYKKWGYDFNDTKYLNYVESYGDTIAEFMRENRDTRIHQALTLTYAEELTYTPVSQAQQFNKNWVIANLEESDYPAWDITALTKTNGALDSDGYYNSRTYSGATTFVENIAAALMSAAGSGATSNAKMTIDFLSQLAYHLGDELLMESFELDGRPTYVLLTASRVVGWMRNPNNTGSIGEHFQNVAEYKDPKRMTIVGEIGRLFENLVVVEDHRAPTLTVGGSAGSYTLRVNYVNPGNNDDRNKSAWSNTSGSANYVFDMCYALGKNALAEYLVDPLNSNMFENTEYGKIEGRAAYLGSGIQVPAFDKDAGSRTDGASTSQIQRGSALVPISRAPIETIT